MPQTLLLVDDSPTIQRVVQLTFAGDAIDVVAAGSVEDAIASIQKSPPSIVLADVGMPGQNGLDLARYLRERPDLARIPVLLLTGAFEPLEAEHAREVGAAGVLVKPFDTSVVVARVKELLGSGLADDGPQPPSAEPADAIDIVRRASAVSVPTATVARLDEYFARLDDAIATRTAEVEARRDEDVPEPSSEETSGELVGAFSALLSAEERGAVPAAFDEWLPPVPDPAPAPLTADTIGDDVVELIVKRVMERLTESVMKDAVLATASATAERLVAEEIERIKQNIT